MALPGLAAMILPTMAELCEEGQCNGAAERLSGEAKGISLIATGRSLQHAVATHLPGLKINDGPIDEFATMEDEFDDNVVQMSSTSPMQKATTKTSDTTKPLAWVPAGVHACDLILYIETIAVIAVFALSAKFFKWAFSTKRGEAPQSSNANTIAASPAEAVEDIDSKENAPVFALGGSKNFAALEQAVRDEDESRCLQLLREGGRYAVRQEDACGCTALHVAAHCGSVSMTRLLLANGAKVDACEAWEETPLHIAARSGSVKVCDLLLSHRAEIDAANAHGFTPLLVAGHAKQEAVCEFLLSRGAGAGGISDNELPPLVNALLIRRMFVGAVPHDSTEVHPDESDGLDDEAIESYWPESADEFED